MSYRRPEDLPVEELRRLLVEKRLGARKDRLEHFRRTGKLMEKKTKKPPIKQRGAWVRWDSHPGGQPAPNLGGPSPVRRGNIGYPGAGRRGG